MISMRRPSCSHPVHHHTTPLPYLLEQIGHGLDDDRLRTRKRLQHVRETASRREHLKGRRFVSVVLHRAPSAPHYRTTTVSTHQLKVVLLLQQLHYHRHNLLKIQNFIALEGQMGHISL